MKHWLTSLILTCAVAGVAHAQTSAPPQPARAPAPLQPPGPIAEPAPPPVASPAAPPVHEAYTLEQLGRRETMQLEGIRNTEYIEFTLPRDRIATQSTLELVYTPSPALLPTMSHLRVYLNDELMSVVPITQEQVGKQTRQQVPLDARLLRDYNRLRLEFIGHYTDICEDLANSVLWVDINRQSRIVLDGQLLLADNDLSRFPEPFFDSRNNRPLELPMVFADAPAGEMQRAAAILASYFGARAAWRGARFPAHYNVLPTDRNSIVFATNDRRPAFLRDYPAVQAPVVEMISHPDNPYTKVLLVLGRNDADLVQAATALAVGNTLFRGSSVTVNAVQQLAPRVPYDAPNWTPTDRPVTFAELRDYPEQLQVSGLRPRPIDLNVNLPPDLFVWRHAGIPMKLKYRYTPPPVRDESRLNVSVNGRFIRSYALRAEGGGTMEQMRLPVLAEGLFGTDEKLTIPALQVGDRNVLRFHFSFASVVGSAQKQTCQTTLQPDVRAAMSDDSTIDFSGFPHYIAMPDLRAYATSGFPFSRMADLSETVAVMPARPTEAQLGTLLDAAGILGMGTGMAGYGLRVVDDWSAAAGLDADVLLLGPLPDALRERPDAYLLLDQTRDWLRQARAAIKPDAARILGPQDPARQPTTGVDVSAEAPMAAIVGMQSPEHPQRSIVALLGKNDDDYTLLRDALGDSGKRGFIAGSVSIVRESGVSGEFVGEPYYVGQLPWWQLLWFHLSEHPVVLAIVAAFTVVLIAALLWRLLRMLARRRLRGDTET